MWVIVERINMSRNEFTKLIYLLPLRHHVVRDFELEKLLYTIILWQNFFLLCAFTLFNVTQHIN